VSDTDDDIALHPKRKANPGKGFVYAGDKRLKAVQKAAWKAGWWPEEKKSGKILWQSPDEVGQVMVHGTSSDNHAYDNVVSEFRKRGLDI
jgi:hypothetical protein